MLLSLKKHTKDTRPDTLSHLTDTRPDTLSHFLHQTWQLVTFNRHQMWHPVTFNRHLPQNLVSLLCTSQCWAPSELQLVSFLKVLVAPFQPSWKNTFLQTTNNFFKFISLVFYTVFHLYISPWLKVRRKSLLSAWWKPKTICRMMADAPSINSPLHPLSHRQSVTCWFRIQLAQVWLSTKKKRVNHTHYKQSSPLSSVIKVE